METHLIALAHFTRLAQLPGLDERLRAIADVGADMAAAQAAVRGATAGQIDAAVAAGGRLTGPTLTPAAQAAECESRR